MAFIATSFAIFSASIITSCQKEDIDSPIGINSTLVAQSGAAKGSKPSKGNNNNTADSTATGTKGSTGGIIGSPTGTTTGGTTTGTGTTTGGNNTGTSTGGTTTGTGGTTSGTNTGTTTGGTSTGTTGGTTTGNHHHHHYHGTSGTTGTTGGSTIGSPTGGSTTGTTGGSTTGATKGSTTTGGSTTGTTGGTTTGGTTTGGTKGGTTTGGTTTGTNSNPTNPTYTTSGPISAKSNTTYSNLLIDLNGSSTTGISVNGATNVHITNCKIINGAGFGINISNSSNVTVDNTFISDIGFGVYAYQSQSIKVNNNQMLNINGINTASLGHAIQFNGVTGGGTQINNNRIESIAGQALHPHDVINVYESSGLPGDSIQVIGNWIRGGQRTLWPTSNSGAAGIVIGDLGGSYQVCRNNILVSPGYVGIQAQGGSHIMVDHNKVYSDTSPASLVGMSWGNYSGESSSDVTYAYNQVKWFNLRNLEDDFGQNGSGVTLINNTWGANLTASILPATIITMK